MAHSIVVTFDTDYVKFKAVCDADEGSRCRLACGEGCEYTETIRTTASGLVQHVLSLRNGDFEYHEMKDAGFCNICEWLNSDPDILPELNGSAKRQEFEIGRFDIEPQWNCEWYEWIKK